uniref:Cysteine-rich PDZ-binding protein n=1 Tax=Melopsittacus undulatus TaxID=13146 RepID=A0A8C6NC35_MELUD
GFALSPSIRQSSQLSLGIKVIILGQKSTTGLKRNGAGGLPHTRDKPLSTPPAPGHEGQARGGTGPPLTTALPRGRPPTETGAVEASVPGRTRKWLCCCRCCCCGGGEAAMVCEKCEKKLGTVITPDTWKDGARNTTESGGRKLNENKALTSKKARFDPYGKNKFAICRICKSSVHQPGSHYCQGCAYKKGICSMCGKKVLDTKNYKQTSV